MSFGMIRVSGECSSFEGSDNESGNDFDEQRTVMHV
jgi:hypothetical protein